jgi:3-oxoadipate enol-lactonase
MNFADIEPGLKLAYRVDDHTDPWTPADTVLMIHGLAESGESWRAWVPHLSRNHRLLRPDLRGYGNSSPMPDDYAWSLDRLVADLIMLLDHEKLARVHVVGAKIGGTIGLRLAALHPDRVISLSAIGTPASLTSFSERAPGWRKQIREHGVRPWAEATMKGRLGSGMPDEAVAWWVDLMAKTAPSTMEGFLQMVPKVDVTDCLDRIRAPSLVITTTGSMLGSTSEVEAWQRRITDSRLEVLPGDSYHVAASDPDACAELVAAFLAKQAAN